MAFNAGINLEYSFNDLSILNESSGPNNISTSNWGYSKALKIFLTPHYSYIHTIYISILAFYLLYELEFQCLENFSSGSKSIPRSFSCFVVFNNSFIGITC